MPPGTVTRHTLGVPERLLPLLTVQPQSGDQLGARLGVNRVTVNTLARRLQERGVPVQISRAGYALAPGTPAPGLVAVRGEFGRALRYCAAVTSTQDEVRAWAEQELQPAPHGAVVVAERQTAGRGRRGRAWTTPHGHLAFSVLLRGESEESDFPPLSLSDLAVMPLAAGVALQAACTALGTACGLKWPNDLLTPDGHKLAGILLEAELRGEEARRAVLGIGLNISAAPEGAAHLRAVTPPLTRAAVLAEVLAALEHWLTQPAPAVLSAWRAASLTLGRPVRVQGARGVIEGMARDLDAQGNLLVDTAAGLQTVGTGEVQLVGALAQEGGPPPAFPAR